MSQNAIWKDQDDLLNLISGFHGDLQKIDLDLDLCRKGTPPNGSSEEKLREAEQTASSFYNTLIGHLMRRASRMGKKELLELLADGRLSQAVKNRLGLMFARIDVTEGDRQIIAEYCSSAVVTAVCPQL